MTWMRRARTALKELALAALFSSGLLWALAAARLRGKTVVLTYHRVLPAERLARSFSAPAIVVLARTFEWQMRFIRKHFRPLNLQQFVESLRSFGPMPPRSCLVTFDDGWYDTLEFALPILRRHGVPAVLFVATDYIGSGECFWQERLAGQLFRLRHRPEVHSLISAFGGVCGSPRHDLDSRESIRDFVSKLKSRPAAEVDSLIHRLEGLEGGRTPADEDRFLGWDEVAMLADSGLVSIGSHAMSHRPLPRIPPGEAERELRESRTIIRSRLRTETAAVAYPNGDATVAIADLAQGAGYQVGFTTRRGLVSKGARAHLLYRVNIHEGSSRTRGAFLARLIGLA